MKKNKNIEMKIYEFLGINIFRKYILFTWEKITKLFKLNAGYRIDKLNIEGLNDYKMRAKGFAITHILIILGIMVAYIVFSQTISWLLFNTLFNGYCIMVQRYNCIRINQVIKKMDFREKAKKSKLEEELLETAEQKQDKELEQAMSPYTIDGIRVFQQEPPILMPTELVFGQSEVSDETQYGRMQESGPTLVKRRKTNNPNGQK